MIIEQLDKPVAGSLMQTLPGSAYTDANVFALEQEKIFERMWFCAVRGSDVAAPGAFKTVQVGRESIIVSRNRKGEPRAFFNVCRHRGMQVCSGEDSDGQRNFRCGYHAWTYDLDGKLIAAPNLTRMPDLDRQDYGLKRVHVREWLGYLWVCVADEAPSFEETVLGEVVDRLGEVSNLDRYAVDTLVVGKRIVYNVKANWKLIIENFMECYHCATIHPELTEVLPEFADGLAAQLFVNHGAAFGEDIKGFTVDGSAGVDLLPGVNPDQDRKYYAITVKPQIFINMVPDHIIFHRMFPISEDLTIVECDWLYLPSVVENGADLTNSVELFDRVNRQDFDVCERTQPSMSSRMYTGGGVLVPAEHHITEFHAWHGAMLAS
ncbi:aromatic ring-hydroxylating oxygenase subunit alpha [Cryobacterium psychrophilum]|uniref:Aromatic ring-hydroxylating dioxygenase subunit alpha n=1 Tax=Cryobacterium psychrophilum TaxID=41988 RepID=A0A4Y8KTZ8_9MICO|nr:aromatic ring-hydroxylating dioxygenase subunit alpha [Cryobacterium psychrophilum]TDW29444.1 Rieske 2Fe-2S family protein [Cryobacterium psychrophilum]TFD81418.1 aromatic ring-hydroxylating dioxygenase subunit alpha [Cryobacterium psychrophilum]